ncbi:unnamed protein product [Orchesella dallaii]|uniref:Uncharacterized protein n=1 Tax=Orchesella dallaii TaxID=48710 RepID=A0ABP1PU42_9HEXA
MNTKRAVLSFWVLSVCSFSVCMPGRTPSGHYGSNFVPGPVLSNNFLNVPYTPSNNGGEKQYGGHVLQGPTRIQFDTPVLAKLLLFAEYLSTPQVGSGTRSGYREPGIPNSPIRQTGNNWIHEGPDKYGIRGYNNQ